MNSNIIATLPDPEYGKKYREKRYTAVSKWEWGMGEDDIIYCRDDADGAIFTGEWFRLDQLLVSMDIETITKIARWTSSLKNQSKSMLDKKAAGSL